MLIPDPDLDFYPSRIPIPGFKEAPDPGSATPKSGLVESYPDGRGRGPRGPDSGRPEDRGAARQACDTRAVPPRNRGTNYNSVVAYRLFLLCFPPRPSRDCTVAVRKYRV